MYTEDVANVLELGKEIDSVLLCGIETHVCVQATALDLVERGADVHCITDACSSRTMVDRYTMLPRVGKLVLSRTALLLCDLQEKFRNQISHFQAITEVSGRMLQAARILGMRVVVTEMYPKGTK
ncbi:hypothetical protein AHF37_03458 [Paragonimus kellicotti]|nr:hypothetical protein AHF37_03458 [Paragonimus kellicotti]